MAYVITAACVGHKELHCILACPADAIASRPADPQLYINPDLCIHCGLCASACPVGAIFPEEDLPEIWNLYAEGYRAYFGRWGS